MKNNVPKSHLRTATHFTTYELAAEPDGEFETFVSLSATLTGFSEAELAGTGMAKTYYEALRQIVGTQICTRFLNADSCPPELLQSRVFGPLARNVIRMWYLGQWKRIPSSWLKELTDANIDLPDQFDAFGRNNDRVLSSQAYQQGLAWTAMGVNPMGAKQPGFGSWSWAP